MVMVGAQIDAGQLGDLVARRNLNRIALLSTIGLLASVTLRAQWVHTNGPYFYYYPPVWAFAASGTDLFAVTDSGVVFSPDAGNH